MPAFRRVINLLRPYCLLTLAVCVITCATASSASAQCAVIGSGTTPWPSCPTWSGPNWPTWINQTIKNETQPSIDATDVNGDGLTDFIYQGNSDSPALALATSNGSSFTGVTQSLPTNVYSNACYEGNFDGSGRAGIACFGQNTLSYATSTGNGFSGFTTQNISNDLYGMRSGSSVASPNPCFVMDVDGDGTDDLVCGSPAFMQPPPNGITPQPSTAWGVYLSKAGGFQYSVWNGPSSGYTQTDACLVGDFNGDGLKDLACSWNANGSAWWILYSTGIGWAPKQWTNGPAVGAAQPCLNGYSTTGIDCVNPCGVGDFNGDGIDDIVCGIPASQTSVLVAFGGKSGSFGAPVTWQLTGGTLPAGVIFGGGGPSTDIYGTGRAGFLLTTNIGSTSTSWAYLASTGTSFSVTNFSTSWSLLVNLGSGGTGLPAPVSQLCQFGDFNGDGIKDVACNPAGNGTWYMGLSSRPQ